MSDVSSVEKDLRAIEAVNQRDVQAALASDTAAMMSQWTDDFVLLQPVGPILRGRSTIADVFRGAESTVEILEYVLDIQGRTDGTGRTGWIGWMAGGDGRNKEQRDDAPDGPRRRV
jgi:ketosteroid isomerase-like protein